MNLKTYSIIVTGIAAGALATLGMWAMTDCDVLVIILVDALIAFLTAAVAATEEDFSEFRKFRKGRNKQKPLYIYDLR